MDTLRNQDHQGDQVVAPFIHTLYSILEKEDPSIIGWREDGKSFQIVNQEALSTQILPRYFRHNKYASFQRQLNYFGFRKWNKSRSKTCTYSQPSFIKNQPQLLSQIKRKPRRKPDKKSDDHKTLPGKSPKNPDDMTQSTTIPILSPISSHPSIRTDVPVVHSIQQSHQQDPSIPLKSSSFSAYYPYNNHTMDIELEGSMYHQLVGLNPFKENTDSLLYIDPNVAPQHMIPTSLNNTDVTYSQLQVTSSIGNDILGSHDDDTHNEGYSLTVNPSFTTSQYSSSYQSNSNYRYDPHSGSLPHHENNSSDQMRGGVGLFSAEGRSSRYISDSRYDTTRLDKGSDVK